MAPVIGAGTVAWLLTALPVTVADGLKKLFDAAIADAATSDVSPSVWIEDVSAACKFAVVAAVSTPIRNEPAGGGFFVVAVSAIDSVVPSGRLKLNVILSPSFGLTAPRSTVTAGGAPVGCVTVAPVSDELTEPSFNPNDEPSSARLVTVVVNGGDETVEMSHVADALIGLAAFVDQLLQPGLRSHAVEHDVGRHGRGVSVVRPENR